MFFHSQWLQNLQRKFLLFPPAFPPSPWYFLKCLGGQSSEARHCLVNKTQVAQFRVYIIPLEPELVISTPTYDPFGTETTYKSKLYVEI